MSTNNGTPEAPASMKPTTDVSEYLDRFRGRAPSEMLGLPRESSLRGSFVVATLTTAVLFAALTVVPYLMSKGTPEPTTQAETPKVEAPKPEPSKPDAKAAVTAPAPKKGETPVATGPIATPPKGPDILDKLNETGVKTASPKVNPLDKKEDDLLKDLDRK